MRRDKNDMPRLLMLVAWLLCCSACDAAPSARGVPFIRSYSYEDIGNVPRGSRLGFDRFGRVAVIHDAIYAVLNDSVWLNIAEPGSKDGVPMANVIQGNDGCTYYGARSSWGYVQPGPDGRLHPVSLAPPNPPDWISTAIFRELVATDDGVYFSSWNGVVYLDIRSRVSHFFHIPKLSRIFRVGGRVYISAYDWSLHYIDAKTGALCPVAETELARRIVKLSAVLDTDRSLLALLDGELVVFDGRSVSPWLKPDRNLIRGDISAMQQLVDGRIAIGVTGQGLLLFSADGELLMALTASEYRNVTGLANREPGVLWAETEDAVEKILYGSPLSAFGQRQGLPVEWPIVALWKGRIVVVSDGKIYRAVDEARGEPTSFEPEAHQPPGGAWAFAAWGDRLLAGSGSGLYSLEDGVFRSVPSVDDLAHLVMTDERHCFVIGRGETAFIEWRDGRWMEPVPRISGLRNPAVVHRVGDSVWVEMGADGIARLWIDKERLRMDLMPNDPRTKESWVNIGAVGDLVVLSTAREETRRFFDQKRGTWVEAAGLQRLFERSPHWIARMQKDEYGVIWATHNEGLVRFTPNGGNYEIDINTFDRVNDRYPVVRLLPNNDVWMSAERSLYHVERNWISASPRPPKPVLVSVLDLQRNEELLAGQPPGDARLRLSHARNNLSFRFYSGTDAWRRAPVYEYRLREDEPWTLVDGSSISLRGLREGSYRLEARLAATEAASENSLPFEFEVAPPWHRSSPAYALFSLGTLLLLFGAVRWSNYLERSRSRKLEEVVRERTHQLETTMLKLGEETRNAATLAERDRLAREIHDSVQQGLTGAILQLDTTLKMPAMNGEVRSRLNVVRNMVSYSRQEVEHAVWDMESPLLDGTELADALRNLTAFVNSGEMVVEVAVAGQPVALERNINHNLLRIAQEAATNALRHARARGMVIRLDYGPDKVSLEIADDGIGFRPDDALQIRGGHLGLRGMRTRVKKMRGTLEIVSAPGAGTRLRVTVPIFKNAETNEYDQ